jgi:pimeloyl-ACP methyl ester carboxylesterase
LGSAVASQADLTAVPVTRYARSGNLNIAYQVAGSGPLDVDTRARMGLARRAGMGRAQPRVVPAASRVVRKTDLVRQARHRPVGPVPDDELPALEQRIDDLRAVMQAAGSQRAALLGFSEGGNMAVLFAASHPDRTLALATFGCFAKRIWSPDYPWAPTPEQREREYEHIEREWGGLMDLSRLPAIRVPTLVMHRSGDLDCNIEEGRYLARHIPGARFIEYPGDDHLPWGR